MVRAACSGRAGVIRNATLHNQQCIRNMTVANASERIDERPALWCSSEFAYLCQAAVCACSRWTRSHMP